MRGVFGRYLETYLFLNVLNSFDNVGVFLQDKISI